MNSLVNYITKLVNIIQLFYKQYIMIIEDSAVNLMNNSQGLTFQKHTIKY